MQRVRPPVAVSLGVKYKGLSEREKRFSGSEREVRETERTREEEGEMEREMRFRE